MTGPAQGSGRSVTRPCTVPVDLAKTRYRARASQRHAGHLDAARGDEELWGEPPRPLGLGPSVQVDTSGPVDIGRLAGTLTRVLTGD